jgi:uncharacterized cupin superfamily protein
MPDLKAHDIRDALRSAPVLRIGAGSGREEADAAFPRLDDFNDGGVFVGRFSGLSPWERHQGADELVYVVDGEVEITVLTDEGQRVAVATAGSVFVVPKGLWHRQLPRPIVTLLSATPQPTDVSFDDDPR